MTKIKMNDTLATVGATYLKGQEYDVHDATAKSWVASGLASHSTPPTKKEKMVKPVSTPAENM